MTVFDGLVVDWCNIVIVADIVSVDRWGLAATFLMREVSKNSQLTCQSL